MPACSLAASRQPSSWRSICCSRASPVDCHPLAGGRAQDLRLAADAHGAPGHRAQGHRARRDRRVLAAQPAAERRPLAVAARRALDAHRLPGARAGEGHRLRRATLPRPTRARGFDFGGDDVVRRGVRPGAGRLDQGGRQRHPARRRDLRRRVGRDAGAARRPASALDMRRRRRARRRVCRRSPALAAGRGRPRPQPVRPRSRRPAAAHGAVRRARSSDVAAVARPRGGAARRGHRAAATSGSTATALATRRSRDAARRGARSRAPTACVQLSVGAHRLPRPGAARRPEEPHLSDATPSSISLCRRSRSSTTASPTIDPALFSDKIVFVGTTASGLFDVFETPFATRQDAGHPDSRGGRRRCPVESLHPRPASASVRVATVAGGRDRWSAWSRRCCRRGGRPPPRVRWSWRSWHGRRRACSPAATG